MGRKVYVSGDMATDPRVLDVADDDPQAALLWPWILMAFDDWGRAEADPRALKFALFPAVDTVTRESIDHALGVYAQHGLVVLYEAEGRRWMAVPEQRWWRWQTHIHRSKREDDSGSHCPRPPGPRAPSAHATDVADNLDQTDPSAESRGISRDSAGSRASLPPSLPPSTLHPPPTYAPIAESDRGESAEPDPEPDESDKSPPVAFAAEFDELWHRYPRRVYRAKALRAFQARMRATPRGDRRAVLGDMAAAVGHYATARQGSDPRHVMHASTWWGPDEPWRDWIAGDPDPPPPPSNGNGNGSGSGRGRWVDPLTAALHAERTAAGRSSP